MNAQRLLHTDAVLRYSWQAQPTLRVVLLVGMSLLQCFGIWSAICVVAAAEPIGSTAEEASPAPSGPELEDRIQCAEKGDVHAQLEVAKFYEKHRKGTAESEKAAAWYRRAAEAGNAEAQYRLGICYRDGEGVAKNTDEAFKWISKSHEQGNDEGSFLYALCLLDGLGVKADPSGAIVMLQDLTRRGHPYAPLRLGYCYIDGEGVEANEAEATRYFMEAATRGVASAKAILGVRYMHGTGVPENAKKGIVLLREAAAEGDVFGQQQLAECLTEGIATERNETEAAQWAKKAADAGDAKSQCRYGLFLEYGTGVPKNQAEALKYYLLAAKQGSAWGQRLVGLVCMHGAGVKKNNIEGCNWMKLAANQGDTFAQWILGEAYAEGQGVPRDPTEALKWLVKAGDSGNAAAQSALGLRLLKGNGLQKDLRRAHEWLKRSAQQGDERGQAALAVAYAFGTGVPKNTRIAYFWACLAASQADVQKLHELVTFLEKQLPLQDITDAQRLAAQFVPQPEGEKEQDGSLPGVADSPRITTGSGFFITADGYFVTNFHVVRKSKRIRIKTASGDHGATLVRSDPGNDLAILKVEGEFAALHVRGSKGLRVADRVFTVGYPAPDVQGLTAKYSSGEVASLSGMGDDACRMQISVPIQPGNSGGPLVDSSGSVVGVVDSQWNKAAAIAEKGILPENVNYAIKGTILLGILEAMPEIASSLVREAESETAATAADVAARVEAATGMVVVAK